MVINVLLNFKRCQLRLLFFVGFLLMSLGLFAQAWPAGAHDPSSIIKDGGTYWTFATGDAIPSMYSTDMVTWTPGPSVFPRVDGVIDYPKWINNYAPSNPGNFWAPDVFYMDSAYYLYYSASEWGTMSSTIGVVKTKSLNPASADYNWVDQGDIDIYSSHPDHIIDGVWTVNAIDASVIRGHDGKIWLIYGSFNKGGIMITQVDSTTGKPFGSRTSIANSYTGTFSGYHEGEGAGMFYRDGYYYLVYNKGGCCAGINSSYYMVIGRSASPTGPFVDKDGKNMKVDGSPSGGTVFFKHDDEAGLDDRYYGPGHFEIYTEDSVDYFSFHYYDPNGNYGSDLGRPTLGLGLIEWGEDGWPMVSFDFVEDGIYSLTNVNSGKAMDLQNHTASENAYLWQYDEDPALNTQKWVFTSLGNGEYSIRNYADFNNIATSEQALSTTPTFPNESIDLKYRVVKGADNKVLVYPTTRDEIFEIPNALTTDSQIKLWWNTNHACQRWELTAWDIAVDFSSTFSDLNLGYSDTTFVSDIAITTDGLWSIKFEDNSWLEAIPATGEGDTTGISIHASTSTTTSPRTNKIFICSHAGEVDTAYVTQAGNPNVYFTVDAEDLVIDWADTTFTSISISTNVPWSISFENDRWIKATPASGEADSDISLTVDANNYANDRTNKIYINSAIGEERTINLTQKSKNQSTGISDDEAYLNGVQVYPNPSSDKVFVKVTDRATINIYNSLGQKMLTTDVYESNNAIDISQFESGLYIFEISMDKGRVQRMILKR